MSKRLITLSVAMAAFLAVAVVPPVASAIELTDGSGRTADTFIRAHNVGNIVMTSSAGSVECTSASLTGHLTQNGPTVSGDISSASIKGTESEERCSSPLGPMKMTFPSLPWCIRSTEAADSFEITGGNCTEATQPITFIIDVGGLACQYQRANVVGSFKTAPEEAILTISESEFAKEAGGFLCPSSTKLDMSFTLENDTEGTNPLYFVVPSPPSAIELTDGSGKTADTFIRAHNVGNIVMTSGNGSVACTSGSLTGHLTQNGPTVISGDISSASFKGTESEERCSSPLGAMKMTFPSLPWCIKTLEGTDTFEVRGGNCTEATRPITFISDVASLACQYQRANVVGSFKTAPEEAILTISESEFAKEGGSFLCPGSTKLDMTFTLENDTAGTTPLFIDK